MAGARPGAAREAHPELQLGCRRIIISDDFHPALTKPNVEVVTEKITETRPHAVVTTDGAEHQVDTLIPGTGFQVMPVADPLRGRDGVPLARRWSVRREAYLGTAV